MLIGWNKLSFESEKEYYEVLGFLAKEEQVIGIITEANDRAGAGGSQGKLTRSARLDLKSIPKALRKVFEESSECRVSETKYIKNLQVNHGFTEEIDKSGADFTKHISPASLEAVIRSVPDEYEKDFLRGYHWHCEIMKRVRNLGITEINYDEHSEQKTYSEGKKKGYYTTKYERNPKNREEALKIHGYKCMICGFDFEKVYGELGKGYIEVHHLKPLATLDEEVVINPATDLVCVCANCHRMLHRFRSYIVSLEELRQLVEDNASE